LRAWLNLRHTDGDRAAAFRAGLRRLGFEVVHGLTCSPAGGDILCSWNRIGEGDRAAAAFQRAGRPVLVAENATWGNDFAGDRWLTIARGVHNTAGTFPVGGPERWDALRVDLKPWRAPGGETVILAQRGIGPAGTAMPRGWPHQQRGRLRPHPGQRAARSLEDDLAKASRVITWGSGAAVKALLMGIPVESHMPGWIGEQDNTDAGRLAMLRTLAWAQWRLSEIESGEAFERLINDTSPAIREAIPQAA
jgi:hypothetical protein